MTSPRVIVVKSAIAVVLAGLSLAGCAGSGEDRLGRLLVAPGGYEFFDCKQLADQKTGLNVSAKNLERLMAKAKEGPAGGFVSAVSYESDYAVNRASAREVEREQVQKKCDANADPSNSAASSVAPAAVTPLSLPTNQPVKQR